MLADADIANGIVKGLASGNTPILNMYGDGIQAGGQPLTAFSATPEQRASSTLLNSETAAGSRALMAVKNREKLGYLNAINGSATPDYPVENLLLGGAGGKAIAGAIERATAEVAVARSPVRTGPYEGAGLTADDTTLLLREVELPPRPGKLIGEAEAARRNAQPEDIRGIQRQNEAAQTLSERGLNVEQLLNDRGKSGLPQPDLRVNGAITDVYSPTTSNVKSVWDAIKGKVDPAGKPQQAPNIVVNLADSPLSASDVAEYVTRNPMARMDSLIIIKNGSVIVLKGGG